jgi:hypothetical protein
MTRIIFQAVLVGISIAYLSACSSKPLRTCPTQTFLQIYQTTPGNVAANPNELFQKTRDMGFDTVFLQWSSYDDVSFYQDPRPTKSTDPRLTSIIKAACSANIDLWLGLHHDSQFWERSAQPEDQVKTYLDQRLLDLKQRLPTLESAINNAGSNANCIKGWYIADEIDDMTWENTGHQKLLIDNLKSTKQLLTKARPKWPIAISGFTNQIKTPQNYAKMWDKLLTKSGIDLLLFQDGIGAEKLSLETETSYIQSLTAMARKKKYDISVVVELFNLTKQKDGTNRFSSANPARVQQQLALAEKAGAKQLAVFAATPYLLHDDMRGSDKLTAFWKNSLLKSCNARSTIKK